ncbi:MAG: DUF1929 domain-containing protein [Nitrospirae bacterium]|nr:DUF1929 domain-containing protein [Nitrospirota bacterium]
MKLKWILVWMLSGCATFIAGCHPAPATDAWGPLVELRDDSERHPEGKPPGGWWITPIHATLLPNGNVLITGWSRRDRTECKAGGTRKNGTTFVLNPASLTSGTLSVVPLDEQALTPGDVLYCAGHVPLPDGRIFFAGGSRYQNLGRPDQIEEGINYARIYEAGKNSFERIGEPMKGGPKGHEGVRWYPTLTRLPDSRILVTGGFTQCCGREFGNLSIDVFDPDRYDRKQSPWENLVLHKDVPPELTAGFIDYPHVYLLPKPVASTTGEGGDSSVVMTGGSGEMYLFNVAEGRHGKDRFTAPPNGKRKDGGEGTTGTLLPTGEILVMGGTDNPAAGQRADFYSPSTDSWKSVNTGISRFHPSSVLLPDGTVLIINGEFKPGYEGDRRRPQTIDPLSRNVTTYPPWPDDPLERGYHNFAVLLKDARVLIGGGRVSTTAEIGCERPDLRIYSPAYLTKGPRPSVVNVREPLEMKVGGGGIELKYNQGPPRKGTGVVLMALGSTTHAFDQNQRYVALPFKKITADTVRIMPPSDFSEAPPGDYLLFVINEAGVPSVGTHLRLN